MTENVVIKPADGVVINHPERVGQHGRVVQKLGDLYENGNVWFEVVMTEDDMRIYFMEKEITRVDQLTEHRGFAVDEFVWADDGIGGQIVGFVSDGETVRASVKITYDARKRIDYQVPQTVNISELRKVQS
jgi:hypothetical protein